MSKPRVAASRSEIKELMNAIRTREASTGSCDVDQRVDLAEIKIPVIATNQGYILSRTKISQPTRLGDVWKEAIDRLLADEVEITIAHFNEGQAKIIFRDTPETIQAVQGCLQNYGIDSVLVKNDHGASSLTVDAIQEGFIEKLKNALIAKKVRTTVLGPDEDRGYTSEIVTQHAEHDATYLLWGTLPEFSIAEDVRRLKTESTLAL